MTRQSVRTGVLAAVAILGACAPGPDGEPKVAAPAAGLCAVGPDDGPVIADRGIGGTGAPPAADPSKVADRGIGGTGIVGVITGFASVCLNGREVAFGTGVPVLIDGQAASPGALRAGQVAVIEAGGPGLALDASRIGVRHEVVGRVDVEPGGSLLVAGQLVKVSPQTRQGTVAAQGDWVAVSGIRAPGGAIEATRLDKAAPGDVLVRGVLQRETGGYRIGLLPLRLAAGFGPVPVGRPVTATGRLRDGALWADAVVRDQLAEDPAAYFGPMYPVLLLEGYVTGINGRLRFGAGVDVLADRVDMLGPLGFAPRRAVIEMRRRPDGGLQAVGLREFGSAGGTRGFGAGLGADLGLGRPQGFQPAPMPNRSTREGSGREPLARDGGQPGASPGRGPSGAGGAGGAGPGPRPDPRR